MSKKTRAKLEKKKRREQRLRRERNLRRGTAAARDDESEEGFDVHAALERLPTELKIERVMRLIARTTGKRVFTRGSEVIAELEALRATPHGESHALAAALVHEDPRERAQDIAFLALDPRNVRFAHAFAKVALKGDPECIDALALRAVFEPVEGVDVIADLEAVVATAERALGGPAFFEDNRGRFWDDVLTRPYLRARRMLANFLLLRGRRAEAEAHFAGLLDLDPHDRLDIGDMLLGLALDRGDLERAREGIVRSEEAGSPVARWARALERWLAGDRKAAAALVREGREGNFFVERELLVPGSTELDEDDLDDREEDPSSARRLDAERVEARIGAAWRAHAEAFAWLAEGGRETTSEAREAVCASFTHPVSALLTIGDDGFRGAWTDYADVYGIGREHVHELIRMATDPALHELDQDDLRTWAATHAWRALGTLGSSEAVEPLLALAFERPDDEYLLADLPTVLGRIGAAALPPLIAVLEDASRGGFARAIVYESFGKVVADDPERRSRALVALAAELERCERQDADLNGWLVAALLDLRAVELAPAIRSAFERGLVEPTIAGDWETVAEELGIELEERG